VTATTVLFAGATGLVGSRALPLLLQDGHKVVALGRRPTGQSHPALTELHTDFSAIPAVPPADVVVCTLGTTIRAAGSQAAFRAVDHDAVLAFARTALAAGCTRAIVVTAVGASPSASAFYSRVKGETEADLEALGFARLDLLQPGLILGPRAERRPVEALFQTLAPVLNPLLPASLGHFGAVPADTIAGAIRTLVRQQGRGVFRHQNRALQKLSTA
jgi:uncharacterized protein YbjT (DUF2867 family)